MQKHLFFITSEEEVRLALSRIGKFPDKNTEIIIVSSDPLANIYLKKQKVKFKDIGNFYPPPGRVYTGKKRLGLLMKKWKSDKHISKALLYKNQVHLNPLIGYSINAFLAETIHSLMTAEEILKRIKPNAVHISPRWTESPFRRYQSENLNLENIALYRLSKQQHLRIMAFRIPLSKSLVAYLFSFFISSLWQSLQTTYFQLFRPAKLPKSGQLAVLANYYQLDNLMPVIKALGKEGKKINVIGKISSSQHKKIIQAIPLFIPLETLEGTSKRFSDIRLVRTIKSTFSFFILLPRLRRFFVFNNQNCWQFLAYKLIYYFVYEFPLFMDYLDGAAEIFKGKTKLLVTPATADNVSRTIVAAAQNSKIPVLELQHGVLPKNDDDITFRTNDFFAVWGDGVRETISDTRNPDKIPVTGYPHFDHYWYPHPMIIHRQAIREKLKFSSSTKVLLILSVFPSGITRIYPNYSPYQFMEMIFEIFTPAETKWKVIFRPHPSVPSSWVSVLAENSGVDFYYDQQKLKLKDAIAASDVIISNPSTAPVEAMFQKKPILLCDFPSEGRAYSYSWWPMVTAGAVKLFKTKTQLNILIKKSVYDQRFRKETTSCQRLFLKNYCSAFSEPATPRVTSLINRLSSR